MCALDDIFVMSLVDIKRLNFHALRDRSLNMARGGGDGGESRGVLNDFFIEMGGLENYIMCKSGGVFGFFPTKGLFLVIYYEQPKEMHKMPFKLEHWVLT